MKSGVGLEQARLLRGEIEASLFTASGLPPVTDALISWLVLPSFQAPPLNDPPVLKIPNVVG